METKLYQFADNSQVTGWLQLMRGGAESHSSHRIPGAEFEYQCGSGFYLPNKTNPVQKLFCQGTLQVDTSLVSSCIRKFDMSMTEKMTEKMTILNHKRLCHVMSCSVVTCVVLI